MHHSNSSQAHLASHLIMHYRRLRFKRQPLLPTRCCGDSYQACCQLRCLLFAAAHAVPTAHVNSPAQHGSAAATTAAAANMTAACSADKANGRTRQASQPHRNQPHCTAIHCTLCSVMRYTCCMRVACTPSAAIPSAAARWPTQQLHRCTPAHNTSMI